VCQGDEQLTGLVQRFWQQEEVEPTRAPLSIDEQICEDIFADTHKRNADGRYVVCLPLIKPLPNFTGTRRTAMRLLMNMERRFSHDSRLQQLYTDFMRQYEELEHMSATPRADEEEDRSCFLPHHGVLREASATTKLRVVFNGSATTAQGDSLNQNLLVGRNLLLALGDVLLRWRRHLYVLAT